MPDFAVTTSFKAQDRITKAFGRMSKGADKFGNSASNAFRKASRSGSRYGDIVKGILTANLITRGTAALRDFGAASVQTAADMEGLEKAFQAVFSKKAGQEMAFVGAEAKRLGLDLKSSADAYVKISAAGRGTVLEGKATRQVFLGIAEASTSLQLSAEQTQGALTAIGQIMSKGKVQAEELRGQLGERIPGAFQIAARAMGMTTMELDKFMASGKLTAEKFIPLFGKQLRKEFGQSAIEASNSFNAARNRFNTLTLNFKRNIGSVLIPTLMDLMKQFSPIITNISKWMQVNRELISTNIQGFVISTKDAFVSMLPALKTSWEIFKSLLPVLNAIAPILPVLVGGMIAYNVALKAQLAIGAIAHFVKFIGVLKGSAGAMAIMNAVMAANPVGAVIIALTALVAVGILVWKNWDTISDKLKIAWNWFNKLLDNPMIATAGLVFAPFLTIPALIIKHWSKINDFFIKSGKLITEKFIDPLISGFLTVAKSFLKLGSFLGDKIGFDISGLENIVRDMSAMQQNIRGEENTGAINRIQPIAPNKSEVESRQNIRLDGNIKLSGANESSRGKIKSNQPGNIEFEMLGINP